MTQEQILEHLRSVEQLCNQARVKLVRGLDWESVGETLDEAQVDLEKVVAEVDRVNRGRNGKA